MDSCPSASSIVEDQGLPQVEAGRVGRLVGRGISRKVVSACCNLLGCSQALL